MASTVLVTGASSGIGAATVRRFLGDGWNAVATMRDPAAAPDGFDDALVTHLDVEDPESIPNRSPTNCEAPGWR